MQRHLDALNACLCGIVADPSSDGVLKRKLLGCETQLYHLQYISLDWAPRNWICKEGSVQRTRTHDVILPYIDVCLIT
ncbi:hypothetical protein BDN70DRAFT_815346 [Pholiota conissans]|uniref:Uncharacterized protein n=1 Tax=Pholiota conissans TaxID=109636 RepID=A0A9P5YT23_9AGAR|nr:hypothetical protein BDN70DRAFT_815346 [Pholiota conissans]